MPKILPGRMDAEIEYWRSFDYLEAYARSRDRQNWPARVAFNQKGPAHQRRAAATPREDVWRRRAAFGNGRKRKATCVVSRNSI